MGSFKKVSFFVARFCLSALFLIAAFAHIADFSGMESSLTNALYSISEHSPGIMWVQTAVEEIIPLTPFLAVIALFLLVVGGGAVLLGIKYKFGALLLIIFLLPTTLIMHHFYFLEGADKELQATMFWKNLAILGGLILLAAYPQPSKFYSEEDS